MREPTIFLSQKLWQFAGDMRARIVAYVSMSIAANLIELATPLIFGAFVSDIQTRPFETAGTSSINYPISH
jgi:hypothetical protein